MPEDDSIAWLGIEAVLRFVGGTQFGVGLMLGLGLWKLQAPNPQEGTGLPERLS